MSYYVELSVIVVANEKSGEEVGKRHLAESPNYSKKTYFGGGISGSCLCGIWIGGNWGTSDKVTVTKNEVTCKTCLKLIEKYGIVERSKK